MPSGGGIGNGVVVCVSDGVVIFYDENAAMEIIIHFRTPNQMLAVAVCDLF